MHLDIIAVIQPDEFYQFFEMEDWNASGIDPDYAFPKIQIALQGEKFIMTDKQLKLLKDRRTPAQIKYEKKNFKLKF